MSLQFVADIHRIAGRLAAVVEAAGRNGGSASDVFALATLRENDLCDIATLQNRLAVPPSTLSSILNRLEKGGLMQRRTSVRDRRTFDLVLTPEGRARAEQARNFLEHLEDQMTGQLSYGQVIAFTEVIEALEKTLVEEKASSQRMVRGASTSG